MSFSKITEDSLGSQKKKKNKKKKQTQLLPAPFRDVVLNKMILCFPETYSWLEEVEK